MVRIAIAVLSFILVFAGPLIRRLAKQRSNREFIKHLESDPAAQAKVLEQLEKSKEMLRQQRRATEARGPSN